MPQRILWLAHLIALPALQNMADKKTLKLRDVRQVGADLKLTLSI
ncbi:MAG: hypothetical protein Q8N30_17030 [Methylococcales bacterium]|nr:hypothetical protein [Methylococcales bacterium]